MSKDARPTSAKHKGGSFFGEIVHRKTWKYALLVSPLAGMAAGYLNLVAEENGWELKDWFGLFDVPLASLMDVAQHRFHFFADANPEVYKRILLLAYIGYWTLIVLLLTPVYCFVRAGGLKHMLRDRTCRRWLIFGAGAGIFIGGTNFLGILNKVEIFERCFNFLDRPGVTLINEAVYRFGLIQLLPGSTSGEVVREFVGAIAYWLIIGLVPATLFCVVRVLRMRKDETPAPVPA